MGHRLIQINQPWRFQPSAQKQLTSEGISLPELLISLVIMGLLSAIALPNYLNSIKSTRQKDVANQLSTIATNIAAYREEFLANPTGWDSLSRISPVLTNNGGAKGTTFSSITSSNGGDYAIAVSSVGNLFSLTGTPISSGSSTWTIKSCLNTQTGLSDVKLGNGSTAAATPVCT